MILLTRCWTVKHKSICFRVNLHRIIKWLLISAHLIVIVLTELLHHDDNVSVVVGHLDVVFGHEVPYLLIHGHLVEAVLLQAVGHGPQHLSTKVLQIWLTPRPNISLRCCCR